MKKLSIIMLLAIVSVAGSSQGFVQIGAGVSTSAKSGTAELFAGGVFRNSLILAAGFQTPMAHVKSNGCQFQGRLGVQINSVPGIAISPYVGVSQFYRSSDDKSLNITRPLYALEVSKPLRDERGKLYLGASKSGGSFIISTGLRLSFIAD